MKRSGLIILGIVVLFAIWAFSSYNGLVGQDEKVNKSWNDLQASYQKRLDQIAQQVETVKGAAKFEQETLTKVIEARSKATSITMETKDATPENIEKFRQMQDQVNSEMKGALSRLLVTVEQYPNLKANENFQMLQKSIESLENEVGGDRKAFNEEVRVYNTKVRSFPANIMAGIFGFKVKEGFKADAEASKRPEFKL
ncbi:MAG: LemA family protein [Bacteroidota bacterium]